MLSSKGLEYLTDVSMDEIHEVEEKMKTGDNPVDSKSVWLLRSSNS